MVGQPQTFFKINFAKIFYIVSFFPLRELRNYVNQNEQASPNLFVFISFFEPTPFIPFNAGVAWGSTVCNNAKGWRISINRYVNSGNDSISTLDCAVVKLIFRVPRDIVVYKAQCRNMHIQSNLALTLIRVGFLVDL